MVLSESEKGVRRKVAVLRKAAEPFLLFKGEIPSGAVSNYSDTVDICQKGLRLCDAVEKLFSNLI